MLNIRYLIVSLAAVFLALGIGIFIGFMFDGQEIFINQQETLVRQLESKFGEIREEKEVLEEEIELQRKQLKNYEEYSENTLPLLINTKLQDTNIAIIETNDDYIYNGIISPIEKAQGNITSITYVKKDFLLEDSKMLEEVYDYFVNKKGISIDKNNFIQYLSDELARAILDQDEEILQYLKEKEIIETKGDYSSTIDYFIIAGGSASEKTKTIEKIDIPFIKKAKQYNIPIVGIEQSNVRYSYMDAYRKEKISTIDNVDTIIGQYSLIQVMQGQEGNFGFKTSADRLIP